MFPSLPCGIINTALINTNDIMRAKLNSNGEEMSIMNVRITRGNVCAGMSGWDYGGVLIVP